VKAIIRRFAHSASHRRPWHSVSKQPSRLSSTLIVDSCCLRTEPQ
jgi:hypothetical protein